MAPAAAWSATDAPWSAVRSIVPAQVPPVDDLPEATCLDPNGRYQGTTSQGEKICFQRIGKNLFSLQFQVNAGCPGGSLEQFTQFTQPIKGFKLFRKKVWKFLFIDDEIDFDARVKPNSARGTLDLFAVTPIGICESGKVSWNAQAG
jgi:hypothetical protein